MNGDDSELWIDPCRVGSRTGVYVRARDTDGTWTDADLAELGKASLVAWLSGMGSTQLRNVIGVVLGHGHLVGPTNAE